MQRKVDLFVVYSINGVTHLRTTEHNPALLHFIQINSI